MNSHLLSGCTGFLLLLTGCAGPPKYQDLTASATSTGDSDNAVVQASGSTAVPVLFTDKKSLQYDTGPMDPDIPGSFSSTASGLRYRILRQSDGPRPKASDSVTVHYRGWLDSGREFDSSYDRGEPSSFLLREVVPGWTEGIQLIGTGGMIELWIPGRLGYGTAGHGNIPPNATLHFVVELIEIR